MTVVDGFDGFCPKQTSLDRGLSTFRLYSLSDVRDSNQAAGVGL